jgi:hypothetical protein
LKRRFPAYFGDYDSRTLIPIENERLRSVGGTNTNYAKSAPRAAPPLRKSL